MRKVELPLAKGFLSPANGGNEGGVKTIERRDSKIRKGSPTYGKHVAVELTEDNHRQFFIPKGFDAPPTLERSGSEHRRAVTSLALLERARAWEWVKDPPAGEGQVGQI